MTKPAHDRPQAVSRQRRRPSRPRVLDAQRPRRRSPPEAGRLDHRSRSSAPRLTRSPTRKSVIDYIEEEQPREEYGRYGNPGERVAERKLAALEGGEDAVLFSSGMAAIVGLLMSKLNAGDEVIFFDECYHRSREFCTKHSSRFGVKTVQVKACDYDAMEAAITPQDAAPGERVADQSALEHRRSRSVRRHRPAARASKR